jgi:hypothetical protein
MPANGAVRHGSASSARSVLSAVSSVTFADLECDLDGDGDGHPASSSFSRQKLSQEVVSFCSDGSFVDRGSTIATNDDDEGGSDDGLVNGRLVERKILDEERRGGVEIGMMDGARRRFRSRQTHGEEEVASSHAALSAMVDSRRASLRQCEVSFLDELLREGDDGQKEMARRRLEDGDVFFAEGEASGVKDEGIEGEAGGEAAEDGVDRRAAFLLAERGGARLSRRSSIWRAHESGLSVTTAGSERSIVGRRRSLTAASGRGLISTAQPVQIGRTASGTRRAAFLDALGREHFLSESSSTLDIVGKGGGDEGGGEDAGVFRRGQEGGSSRIILSTIAGQEWVRGDGSSAAAATATTGARGTNDDGNGKIGGAGVAFEGTSDQSAPVPEIPATQPGAVIRPASLLQSGRSVSVGSTRSVRFARGHSIQEFSKNGDVGGGPSGAPPAIRGLGGRPPSLIRRSSSLKLIPPSARMGRVASAGSIASTAPSLNLHRARPIRSNSFASVGSIASAAPSLNLHRARPIRSDSIASVGSIASAAPSLNLHRARPIRSDSIASVGSIASAVPSLNLHRAHPIRSDSFASAGSASFNLHLANPISSPAQSTRSSVGTHHGRPIFARASSTADSVLTFDESITGASSPLESSSHSAADETRVPIIVLEKPPASRENSADSPKISSFVVRPVFARKASVNNYEGEGVELVEPSAVEKMDAIENARKYRALMVSELSASNVSNGQSVQSNMIIEEFTTPGVFRRTLSDDNYGKFGKFQNSILILG